MYVSIFDFIDKFEQVLGAQPCMNATEYCEEHVAPVSADLSFGAQSWINATRALVRNLDARN